MKNSKKICPKCGGTGKIKIEIPPTSVFDEPVIIIDYFKKINSLEKKLNKLNKVINLLDGINDNIRFITKKVEDNGKMPRVHQGGKRMAGVNKINSGSGSGYGDGSGSGSGYGSGYG